MANLAVIPSGSARLALCDRAPTRDGIDGAWWPRNADVGAELADVVSLFGLSSRLGVQMPASTSLFDGRRFEKKRTYLSIDSR